MPDYNKGKIYTIRCRTDNTLIYVGSTIQPLAVRWGEHKRRSKIDTNRYIYTTINNNWDNWYIELYELYPCNCKEELCKKEGEVIREIGTLNTQIAGRTQKEWIDENKEKIAETQKIYREVNKDRLKENEKIRRGKRTEYLKTYTKIYAENNKEKLAEYKKQYYQRKKEANNNILI